MLIDRLSIEHDEGGAAPVAHEFGPGLTVVGGLVSADRARFAADLVAAIIGHREGRHLEVTLDDGTQLVAFRPRGDDPVVVDVADARQVTNRYRQPDGSVNLLPDWVDRAEAERILWCPGTDLDLGETAQSPNEETVEAWVAGERRILARRALRRHDWLRRLTVLAGIGVPVFGWFRQDALGLDGVAVLLACTVGLAVLTWLAGTKVDRAAHATRRADRDAQWASITRDAHLDRLRCSRLMQALTDRVGAVAPADAGERLPLILDDPLVHVAGADKIAVADLLAELASRTQVILLTGNARTVELAWQRRSRNEHA